MSGQGTSLRAPKATADRAKRLRRKPSAVEGALWAELKKLNLGLSRQAPLGPYVVDFVHHPSRLAIDLDREDGSEESAAAVFKQGNRRFWLEDAGYRLIRIKERDVRAHLAKTVEQIALETKAPRPQGGAA